MAKFAIYLQPTKIFLRFLNYHINYAFDDLKNIEKIINKIENIEFSGHIKLETEFNE
jgi:hypothetical protein